ncbi:MAG: hypothetical protein QXK27_03650 [Candidatus Hadarchaeales archaeon]
MTKWRWEEKVTRQERYWVEGHYERVWRWKTKKVSLGLFEITIPYYWYDDVWVEGHWETRTIEEWVQKEGMSPPTGPNVRNVQSVQQQVQVERKTTVTETGSYVYEQEVTCYHSLGFPALAVPVSARLLNGYENLVRVEAVGVNSAPLTLSGRLSGTLYLQPSSAGTHQVRILGRDSGGRVVENKPFTLTARSTSPPPAAYGPARLVKTIPEQMRSPTRCFPFGKVTPSARVKPGSQVYGYLATSLVPMSMSPCCLGLLYSTPPQRFPSKY